jgi:Bacterial DNA-binding protein.
MDRSELIKTIKGLNDSSTIEDVELFIDNFFKAIKKGLDRDGNVEIGQWGEFYKDSEGIDYYKKKKKREQEKENNNNNNNNNNITTTNNNSLKKAPIPPTVKTKNRVNIIKKYGGSGPLRGGRF